ncbi:hypothetical protein FSARC_13523 [Fusarium sarcochroum]|uniref:Transcription factor domain-containing protein n=1 Tax=Fusarium sarcochroum TaxID=1208366 RepID=A0A8H4T0Y1_9HYPO|nr:hypothetical protein FSARC_13523 [Fusarium sarcochroum]
MFEFVVSPCPDQVQNREHHRRTKQRPTRRNIQKQRERQRHHPDTNAVVQPAGLNLADTVTAAYHTWLASLTSTPFSALSCHLLDPFDTLCESPERLRQLLRHRKGPSPHPLLSCSSSNLFHIASAKSAGEPLFRIDQQTDLLIFQSFHFEGGPTPLFTDKTLFHALSLLLALVANDYQPNCETMHHRGQVLKSLNVDLSNSHGVTPSLQTIVGILILISYEYRVQDTWFVPAAAATHIHGLQSIIHQRNTSISGYHYAHIKEIQRALFWQDITCSLATSTPRLLQFENHDVLARLRENQIYRSYFVLPEGLLMHIDGWPANSSAVFEDLNSLCHFVDRMHTQKTTSVPLVEDDMAIEAASIRLMKDSDNEGYPLCNSQANLEIRLVDLLSETMKGASQKQEDLIYRACLFAAYLCTYRLSAGFWEGCFCPEKCVTEILSCMIDFMRLMSPWNLAPDISFWLLYVAGSLTKNQHSNIQAAVLVQRYRCFYPAGYYQDWEVVEAKLRKFIWCEYAMKQSLYEFWQQCQDGGLQGS